jgi:hypothetical protein
MLNTERLDEREGSFEEGKLQRKINDYRFQITVWNYKTTVDSKEWDINTLSESSMLHKILFKVF